MRHVDLEDIKTSVDHDPRRTHVVLRDPGDVGRGRRADHLHAQRRRHPRRGEGVHPVRPAVGHRSGVPELAGHLGPGLVDRLGEPRQAGRRLAVDDDDLLLRTPLGSDGQIGDRRQADTAAGRREVIVDELVGDQAVRRAALERGRLDRTVAQPHRPEGRRLENTGRHQRSRVLRMKRIVLSAVATCFS